MVLVQNPPSGDLFHKSILQRWLLISWAKCHNRMTDTMFVSCLDSPIDSPSEVSATLPSS